MKDPRLEKLAKSLVNYSVKVQKGQKLIIEGSEQAADLIVALVREAYRKGALPFVRMGNERISREVLLGVTEEYSKTLCGYVMPMFADSDCYIGIGASYNLFESADVPSDNKTLHSKFYGRPITDVRCTKPWAILHYPNASFAQQAQTSLEAFEDFYFDVCNLDYGKMARAMQPLKELIERTDRVRIVAADTDLTFSIKGQKAEICAGTHNIPDGEIFTAPVKTSINGKIHFNLPSLCKGIVHNDIVLTFKDGKIIKESSSNTDALTAELNSDEGARYTGEFAFGVNPYITKAMCDTLFDEKIAGSIHMAMGNCYDSCPNGNKSQIHWDMIQSHDPKNGGGEIYFDDVLIRKDGRFVLKELDALNPENLK